MRDARGWMLAAAALVVAPGVSWAQVRASEPASVSQTVDGTTLTVEYSRPRTRGRDDIYGKFVTWGEVWTPGANMATTLEATSDVTVDGHAVPKGKYSVWMEVEPKEWTVILDPRVQLFHLAHPKPDSTQIRFSVTPDSSIGPEVLTWSFPGVSATGMTIRMAWAGKSVSMKVAVPALHPITLAADLAARYVGKYSYEWTAPDPEGPPTSAEPMAFTWNVKYEDGKLLVDWVPPPFDEWSHLVLITVADDWFNPGAIVDGELYDVVTDLVVEFEVKDGKATGFEVRAPNDELIGRGTRVK